tara:strand:- start:604 stop:1227 length:624 start_codon:yes stop_codon:yes gene_type:complete
MIRKNLFRIFYFPNLCNKIDTVGYPWGWKSKNEIDSIKNYKLLKNEVNISNYELKYIHEYKMKEYCEEMYLKTYHSYLNEYDFLNTNLISPNLANGLNYLRSNSNINKLNKNIKINKVKIMDSWIKYGRVNNTSKYFGYYNINEVIHEISAGMIGPEVQSIWDQRSVKQKIKLNIELEDREDIFEFERDLMSRGNNWQLCNINRIIV